MESTRRARRGGVGRAVMGIFLVLLGGTLLAGNLGYDIPYGIWNYWPFFLIFSGLARMIFGGGKDDGESRNGGLWILLGGLYSWISIWHLWGLNWATASPIFIIAGGIAILLRPVFGCRDRGPNDSSGSIGGIHVG
ncbi:MAG: DUF5668 domain-containing protein [Thermoanaerobaculia bacterium]